MLSSIMYIGGKDPFLATKASSRVSRVAQEVNNRTSRVLTKLERSSASRNYT